jgi:hypothetical protein
MSESESEKEEEDAAAAARTTALVVVVCGLDDKGDTRRWRGSRRGAAAKRRIIRGVFSR